MTTEETQGLPEARSAGRDEDTSLSHRVRRAAMWTGASTIVLRLSNILVMAVVARIIAPEELGVYAIAITVHGFIVCLASWGVTAAIARSDLDADRIGPTVVTIAVCSSCVLAGSMALAAGPVAGALGVPEAAGPIRILAIALVLQGIFAIPGAQIHRELRQEVIFRASAFAIVAESTALLILVHVMSGADAFAWSRVIGGLTIGVVIVSALDRFYLPGWQSRYVGPLLRFGIPAALGTLLSQLVLNVDFVIIGREMTAVDLGLYMLAFNICTWPTAVLGAVMDQVVVPAFSGVRRDRGDLRSAVFRAVRAVAFVACPIGAVTLTFSASLIETVYGAKWLPAAPVLSVLAIYGVLFVVVSLFNNMMIAAGKTMVMFAVQAAALVALIPVLIIGIRVGGLVGVGIGHILVVMFVTLPAYAIAMRATANAGLGVMVRAFSRPALAAVAAAVVARGVTEALSSPVAKLVVGGVTALLVYAAAAGPQLLQMLPGNLAGNRILGLATTWPSSLAKHLRTSESPRGRSTRCPK